MVGCISKEEKERAEKYSLRYVYIDQAITLKEISYSIKYFFLAKYSTENLIVELYYLNFHQYFAQTDNEKKNDIHKSLIGLTLEMYEKKDRKLIYTYHIKEAERPYFSMATPSLSLGGPPKVKRGHEYEIILKVPAKKDTEDEYLRPTFVVGILKSPPIF